jgi:hypothetical protein
MIACGTRQQLLVKQKIIEPRVLMFSEGSWQCLRSDVGERIVLTVLRSSLNGKSRLDGLRYSAKVGDA